MDLTKKERDCLVLVNEFKSDFPPRLIDIAKKLQVQPPTAYNLVVRLERKGLIEENRGSIIITQKGKSTYRDIIMMHRCFETLLNKAGMSANVACKEAEKVDYLLDANCVKPLLKFIGNPKICPHGKPIVVN